MRIFLLSIGIILILSSNAGAAFAFMVVEDPFASPGTDTYETAEGLFAHPLSGICTSGGLKARDAVFAEIFKFHGSPAQDFIPGYASDDSGFCFFEKTVAFDFPEAGYGPGEPLLVTFDLASYRFNNHAIRSVERNLKVFTTDIRDRFAVWLGRSSRYIRMMKAILKEEGLPEDMAYLPLIESGFNTRAYSRSRAAGPWQFIAGTGKRYGLRVDWWVDERRDPVKSTRAAARYLKDLYGMFDSWSLAMAAYNAGEGRIKRALRKTGSNDYWRLLKTRYIRRETKNYVPKFIAARMIAVAPEKYGFDEIKYLEDFTFDEVTIESPLSLDVVARCAGTTTEAIKELNPELRRWSTPPVKSYTLRIPRGAREDFLASLPRVPEGKRVTVKVHRVRRGDTVSEISERYHVSQSVIISYNKLNRRGFLRVGQRLIIPVSMRKN